MTSAIKFITPLAISWKVSNIVSPATTNECAISKASFPTPPLAVIFISNQSLRLLVMVSIKGATYAIDCLNEEVKNAPKRVIASFAFSTPSAVSADITKPNFSASFIAACIASPPPLSIFIIFAPLAPNSL